MHGFYLIQISKNIIFYLNHPNISFREAETCYVKHVSSVTSVYFFLVAFETQNLRIIFIDIALEGTSREGYPRFTHIFSFIVMISTLFRRARPKMSQRCYFYYSNVTIAKNFTFHKQKIFDICTLFIVFVIQNEGK